MSEESASSFRTRQTYYAFSEIFSASGQSIRFFQGGRLSTLSEHSKRLFRPSVTIKNQFFLELVLRKGPLY